MKGIFWGIFVALLLTGTGASAQFSGSLWFPDANDDITPVDSNWGIKIPTLTNCDTIDTDANGVFSCGVDSEGAGGEGDAVQVNGTAIDTTANFTEGGQINFVFTDGGAGGPDIITGNVHASSTLELEGVNATSSTITDLTITNDILLSSGSILNFDSGDVTITHSANALSLAGGTFSVGDITLTDSGASSLITSGDANFYIRNSSGQGFAIEAGTVSLDAAGNFNPDTNNSGALGTSGTAWADLFLASGAVINFNAGDVTLTHSADTLTFAGGTLDLSSASASLPVISTGVWEATDVGIAHGGTGASNSSTACTNLLGSADLCDGGDASGGGGLTVGSETQVPFVTVLGDDLDYDVDFTFASTTNTFSVTNASTTNLSASGTVQATNVTIDGGDLDLDGNRIIFDVDADSYLESPTDDEIVFTLGGTESEKFNGTEVVFNESGADRDFRIEGTGLDDAFFVDGSNGRVGLGTQAPQQLLDLEFAAPAIRLTDTTADANDVDIFLNEDELKIIDVGIKDLIVFNVQTGKIDLVPSAGDVNLRESSSLDFNDVEILSDTTGTLTLDNVDALGATTESTIEAAIDTLANLTSIQGLTVTLADAGADAFLGWDDTASAYENLTAAEALAIIGGAANDFDASGDVTIAIADISDLGTGVGTWLGTPSSANFASAVTGETGTGAVVFGTAPTFTTSLTVTGGATIDADGIDLVTGNDYEINGAAVLNATTLGSAVVNSSLTSVGTLTGGATGAGFTVDLDSSTLTCTGCIQAGDYAAASIDGDDLNSNIAGAYLTLTAASPDTLDLDDEVVEKSITWIFARDTDGDDGFIASSTAPTLLRVAVTLNEFNCTTTANASSTMQLEQRSANDAWSAGTSTLSSELTSGGGVASTTSFSVGSLDAYHYVSPVIVDASSTVSDAMTCSLLYKITD